MENSNTAKIDYLNKYKNDLIRYSEMYINKEVDIVEYVYLINNVAKCIKVTELEHYEDNE